MHQPFHPIRAVLAAVLLVGAGLLPGCSKAADNKVVVGEYGSMSGGQKYFGDTTHMGIMIAVEEQNKAGGIKGMQIDLHLENDNSSSSEASTVVEKLITQEHAKAILGEVASGNSIAGGKMCERYGVPMISPSSTNPVVTQTEDGRVASMVFRACFLDPFQGAAMARFAYSKLGVRKVAVLYNKSQPYSDGLREAFVAAFKRLGGTVTVEQAFVDGNQNFKPQLTTIRDTNPDAIFVPVYSNIIGSIAEQARKELGMKMPLLGGDGWEEPEMFKRSGEWLEGCYFTNHAAPDENRPEVRNFVQKFKEKYQIEPGGLAMLGYDAARILFKAMNDAPTLSGKDIAASIAAIKDFPGASGKITINDLHNADKSAVVLKITDKQARYEASIDYKDVQ